MPPPTIKAGPKPEERETKTSGRVLVLLRGALGDVLLTLPLLKALPDHFQARDLTLVGNPVFLSLLANQPFVARIEDHNRAHWAGLYCDEPQLSDQFRSFILQHRAAVVAARKLPDPGAEGLIKTGLSPVATMPSRPPSDQRIHLVEHMAHALGIKLPAGPVPIKPEPMEISKAREFFQSRNIDPDCCLALHPGSGGVRKNWPLDNWLHLARSVRQKYGIQVLIILGPAEEELHPGLDSLLKNAGLATVSNAPLPALAGILSLVRAFCGHDTGVTHLAAGLGIPTTALFGPTDPAHWHPLGPRVNILAPMDGPKDSWDWLEMEKVEENIGRMMNKA